MRCAVRPVRGCEAGRPDSEGEADGSLSKRPPMWRRIGPFLVAAGIMCFLFLRIDMRACLEALCSADISFFIPWLLAFILSTFLLDAQNLAAVLREFGHPVAFRSALGIRGGTYLLMTIDHTLGLGALVYCLRRQLSIPVIRSTGLMLFFNTVTQFTLVVMALTGLVLVTPATPFLRYFFVVCIAFAVAVVLFVAAVKRLPPRGCVGRKGGTGLVGVFREASWKSCGTLVIWRGVYYVPFIVFFHAAAGAFHMAIPFVILAAYVPIILLVVSLPVTPGGFGTAQAAMIYLLGDFGSSGTIMAFGLTYSTSILLLRSLIGLVFAGSVSGLAPGGSAGSVRPARIRQPDIRPDPGARERGADPRTGLPLR